MSAHAPDVGGHYHGVRGVEDGATMFHPTTPANVADPFESWQHHGQGVFGQAWSSNISVQVMMDVRRSENEPCIYT